MIKHLHWLLLAALLAGPFTFAVAYAREFLAVDSALDAGASYDYRVGKADFTRNHPYSSFSERHRGLFAIAGGSVLGLTLYLVVMIRAFIKRSGMKTN